MFRSVSLRRTKLVLWLLPWLLVCRVHAAPVAPIRNELYLDVTLNGRSIPELCQFFESGGKLDATIATLRRIGLRVPEAKGDANARISLDDLPGVQYHYDSASQTIAITAHDVSQEMTGLDYQNAATGVALQRGTLGALVDYDVQKTNALGVGGDFTGRIFGPFGLLSSEAIVVPNLQSGRSVRLDTSYSYADPDNIQRFTAGDFISSGLSWSNSVRLGGVQLATDFTLRPDLVTFPVTRLSGSAAVPSTVDVLVNGIRQFSDPIPAGPFEINRIPLVTGSGDISLVVRDASGRETIQTVSYYASVALLQPGLASYALEAGAVRRSFGALSDDYGSVAYSATGRYGLTDSVTLESHGEATDHLVLAGAGAVVRVGEGAVGSADLAASNRLGANGLLLAMSIQHQAPEFSFGASAVKASTDYYDIAALNGNGAVGSSSRLNFGWQLPHHASLGLAYTRVIKPGIENVALLTTSYGERFADNIYGYASLFKDFKTRGDYGLAIGVVVPLGDRRTLSTTVSRQGGALGAAAEAMQSAIVQGDWGWRVSDDVGAQANRDVEAEYVSPWGKLSAEANNAPQGTYERLEARGAVVLLGGLHLANYIDDSFALVRVADHPDVSVRYENRLVGTTDANGEIFLPTLRSYDANQIEIDSTDLPIDATLETTRLLVKPADHIGVVVAFKVKAGRSAIALFVDAKGRALPVGSVATIVHTGETVPIGYDGEAFFESLEPDNDVEIHLGASHCKARFQFAPIAAEIPRLGPITCQ